jgi:membrane protease YdiL (CAAX protease family)
MAAGLFDLAALFVYRFAMDPNVDIPMCPLPAERGYDLVAMLVVLALFSLFRWWWLRRKQRREIEGGHGDRKV